MKIVLKEYKALPFTELKGGRNMRTQYQIGFEGGQECFSSGKALPYYTKSGSVGVCDPKRTFFRNAETSKLYRVPSSQLNYAHGYMDGYFDAAEASGTLE